MTKQRHKLLSGNGMPFSEFIKMMAKLLILSFFTGFLVLVLIQPSPQDVLKKDIRHLEDQVKDPEIIVMVKRAYPKDETAVENYDYDPKSEYYIHTMTVPMTKGKPSPEGEKLIENAAYDVAKDGVLVQTSQVKNSSIEYYTPSYVTDKKTAEKLMHMMKDNPSEMYTITSDKVKPDAKNSLLDKYSAITKIKPYSEKDHTIAVKKLKKLKKEYVETYGEPGKEKKFWTIS